jgi:hypothetical protein
MKFAAIGTDGRRPVVWGLGADEEAARLDGEDELRECGGGEQVLRVVSVSDERAEDVLAGDVDASYDV